MAVIIAESGGHEFLAGRPIISRAGAMGLMQLMPETWEEMRAAHELGEDPFDARDNILAGTAYLRSMYNRFGYPGLFAAYNAGPSRYSRLLTVGEALPGETVAYLAKVTGCAADSKTKQACLHPRRIGRRHVPNAPGLFVLNSKGHIAPISESLSAHSDRVRAIGPP